MTVMERDEEDILDSENLIQEDKCSEQEEAELEYKIIEEHTKYSQLRETEERTRLRARSAPVGSPSSAKQRKRSAERVKAREIHVEENSPRELFVPSYETGSSDDPMQPRLETVTEDPGMLQGSEQRSPGGTRFAAEAEKSSPAAPLDPYSFAMELFERDMEAPIQQYRSTAQRPSSAPATRKKSRSDGPSAMATQGMLGFKIPSKKERSRGGTPLSGRQMATSPAALLANSQSMGLSLPPRPQSARPSYSVRSRASCRAPKSEGGYELRRRKPEKWGGLDKNTLPQSRTVGREVVGDTGIWDFNPTGWNQEYAEKVRLKVQEANEFNAKLGLRSTFRLVPGRRIGPEETVGVEVTSAAAEEPALKVISLQAFLNTHNRLRKLINIRRKPRKQKAEPMSMGISPSQRKQAELKAAVHDSQDLCSTLADQIAALKRIAAMEEETTES